MEKLPTELYHIIFSLLSFQDQLQVRNCSKILRNRFHENLSSIDLSNTDIQPKYYISATTNFLQENARKTRLKYLDLSGAEDVQIFAVDRLAEQLCENQLCHLLIGTYKSNDPAWYNLNSTSITASSPGSRDINHSSTQRKQQFTTLSPTISKSGSISLASIIQKSAKSLSSISVAHRTLSNDTWEILSSTPSILQSLRSLDLRNTNLTISCFQTILSQVGRNLITLRIMKYPLTPLCMIHLSQFCRNLVELECVGCWSSGTVGLVEIQRTLTSMPNLSRITITGLRMSQIDPIIQTLAVSCKKIESIAFDIDQLYMHSLDLTRQSVETISKVPSFRSLRCIRISNAPYLTNTDFTRLVHSFAHQLKILDIRNCSALTAQSLGICFTVQMKCLEELIYCCMPQQYPLWSNEYITVFPRLQRLCLIDTLYSQCTGRDLGEFVDQRCPNLEYCRFESSESIDSKPWLEYFARARPLTCVINGQKFTVE